MAYGDNLNEVHSDDFGSSIDSGWENPSSARWGDMSWVSANVIELGSSGSDCAMWRNTGTYDDDQYSEITIDTSTNGSFHLVMARGSSSDGDCYSFEQESAGADDWQLFRVADNGTSLSWTSLDSTAHSNGPMSTDDTMRIECEGTTIRGGSNEATPGGGDTERCSTTDATYSSGRPGCGGYDSNDATDVRFKAWSGGSIGAVASFTPKGVFNRVFTGPFGGPI